VLAARRKLERGDAHAGARDHVEPLAGRATSKRATLGSRARRGTAEGVGESRRDACAHERKAAFVAHAAARRGSVRVAGARGYRGDDGTPPPRGSARDKGRRSDRAPGA